MSALHEALDRYRLACESFRWEVPDSFNFGRDVVDRFAEEPERPASPPTDWLLDGSPYRAGVYGGGRGNEIALSNINAWANTMVAPASAGPLAWRRI